MIAFTATGVVLSMLAVLLGTYVLLALGWYSLVDGTSIACCLLDWYPSQVLNYLVTDVAKWAVSICLACLAYVLGSRRELGVTVHVSSWLWVVEKSLGSLA